MADSNDVQSAGQRNLPDLYDYVRGDNQGWVYTDRARGYVGNQPDPLAQYVKTQQYIKTLNAQQSQVISDAIRQDPNLAHDPTLLYSLSKNTGMTGQQISNVSNFMRWYGQSGNKLTHPGPSVWTELGNAIAGFWDKANTPTSLGGIRVSPSGGLGYQAPNIGQIGKDIYQGGLNVASSVDQLASASVNTVEGIVNRSLLSIGELFNYDPKFLGGTNNTNYFQNLDDINRTLGNLTNVVNPWSSQNAFMLANHFWSYFQTLSHKFGTAYALENIAPSFVLAFATGGAGLGADVANAAEVASVSEEDLAAAEEALKNGDELTAAQKSALLKARRAGTDVKGLKPLLKYRDRAAQLGEIIGSPFSVARGALGALKRNSVPLMMSYGLQQLSAENDPNLKKLWEETADGSVYGANGQRLDTLGQDIMKMYFGQNKDSLFYSPDSGIIDFASKFLAPDPLKAFSDLAKARRTVGFTGYLGKWWGGLGISSAEDIYRTEKQYLSSRVAYEFMATHTAEEINREFRNTYSREVLDMLGRADSVEEVLGIHALIADGYEMTLTHAPTMGMYSLFKSAVRSFVDNKVHWVGEMLLNDDLFAKNFDEMARSEVGIGTAPDGDFYVANKDATLRFRAQFAKWVASRVSHSPQYFDEVAKRMENVIIRPKSLDAVNAIGDMGKLALLPATTIKAVKDFLVQPDITEEQFANAYRLMCWHIVMRRVMAGIPQSEFDTIRTAVGQRMWDEVIRATGVDMGGREGRYTGSELSDSVGQDVKQQNAAYRLGQRGQLRFANARTLNSIARTTKEIVLSHSSNIKDINETLNNLEQILSLAKYNHADLGKLRTVLTHVAASSSLRRTPFKGVDRKAYENTVKQILDRAESVIRANEGRAEKLSVEEVFADFYNRTKTAYALAQSHIKAVEDIIKHDSLRTLTAEEAALEYGGMTGITDFGVDASGNAVLPENILNQLKAELQAHQDTIKALNKICLNKKAGVGYREVLDYAHDVAKLRSGAKEQQERYAEKLAERLNTYRVRRPQFQNNWQIVVDALHSAISRTFIPMALTSTRWAEHVGISEALLNSMRQGGLNYVDSRVMLSVVKHEMVGMPFSKQERNALRMVIGGIVLGLERSWLQGLEKGKLNRFIDDITGFLVRHDGHVLGGIEHGAATAFNGSSAANQKQTVFDVSEGEVSEAKYLRSPKYGQVSYGEGGYAKGLEEQLTSLHLDESIRPILQALHDAVYNKGLEALNADPRKFAETAVAAVKRYFTTGPGKKELEEYTQRIGAQIDEITKTEDFINLNQEQQDAVLNYLLASIPTADDIAFDSLKPYLQKQYAVLQKMVDKFDELGVKTQQEIESITKMLDTLVRDVTRREKVYTKSVMDAYDNAKDSIGVIDQKIKELQEAIEKHPYKPTNADKQELVRARQSLAELRQKTLKDMEAVVKEQERRVDAIEDGTDVISIERLQAARKALKAAQQGKWNKVVGQQDFQHLEDALQLLARNNRSDLQMAQDYLRWEKSQKTVSEVTSSGNWEDGSAPFENPEDFAPFYHAALYAQSDASNLGINLPQDLKDWLRWNDTWAHDVMFPPFMPEGSRGPLDWWKQYGEGWLNEADLQKAVEAYEQGKSVIEPFLDRYDRQSILDWIERHDPQHTRISPEDVPEGNEAKPPIPSHGMPWAKDANETWNAESAVNRESDKVDNDRISFERLQDELSKARADRKAANKELNKRASEVANLTPVEETVSRELEQYKKRLDNLHQQAADVQVRKGDAVRRQGEIKANQSRIAQERAKRLAKKLNEPLQKTKAVADRKLLKLARKLQATLEPVPTLTQAAYTKALKESVLRAGRNSFHSNEDLEALIESLVPTAKDTINGYTEDERNSMVRSRLVRTDPNVRYSDDPIEDWAHTMAGSITKVFVGSSKKGNIIHGDYLDMALTGEIPYGHDFASIVAKKGQANPVGIPAKGFRPTKALEIGAVPDLIKRVADVGHDKVLAPIVNYISRYPTMLLEYHNQMELLRPLIERGTVSEMEAEVMAETRAMIEMYKYVHSPIDKLNWENNMRLLAPFYFAKNQAWRRAFRLLQTDPGAFERYLKICLGVTNSVSVATAGGKMPSIFIPGSTLLGPLASGFTSLPGFGSLAFSFTGSPGSIDSMVPTGSAISPGEMLGNFVRPPWGPIATLPLKMVRAIWGTSHPAVSKVVNGVLGPISATSSWVNDVFPSTSVRDAVNLLQDTYGHPTSAFLTAQNEAMQNAMLNRYQQLYQKEFNQLYKQPWWNSLSHDEQALELRGYTDYALSQELSDPSTRAKYISDASNVAMFMTAVRAALNLGSPVALSLQENFSQYKEFNNILNQKNPDGSSRYSFTQAADMFTQQHPERIFDIISRSSSQYESYPETTAALKAITDHPSEVKEFPYAMAFLLPRTGQFNPQARMAEMNLALRSPDTPEQFFDAIRVSLGNDYYYNYLRPYVISEGGGQQITIQNMDGSTSVQQGLSAAGAKTLNNLATAYAQNINPVWGDYHSGNERKAKALQAMNQMETFLTSNVSSFVPKEEKEKFLTLIKDYKVAASYLRELHSQNLKTEAYNYSNALYAFFDEADKSPYYAQQQYFIDTVLRKLPDTY